MIDRMEGQPLRKKISSSLVQPSSLLGYQSAFTRNATEMGWLEIAKSSSSPQWQRRWFVLKDGVIRHAATDSREDDGTSVYIPIENIIRLVTDNKKRRSSVGQRLSVAGGASVDEDHKHKHLITMKTTSEKLILRAETSDDLNRWVFAFQKSVALAMTNIMMARSQRLTAGISEQVSRDDNTSTLNQDKDYDEDDDGWARLARTRTFMHDHANLIASAKIRQSKGGARSMSIDDTMMPLVDQQREHSNIASASAAALRVRASKELSSGDLTHQSYKEDRESISALIRDGRSPPFSTPTSPAAKVSVGGGRSTSSGFSSLESSPRSGLGTELMMSCLSDELTMMTRGTSHTSSGSSGLEDNERQLGHSSDSISATWRSVDDMCVYTEDLPEHETYVAGANKQRSDLKEKMSPNSYSVGRTRSNSGSGGSSGLELSPSGRSSGSLSLQGEGIASSSSPLRQRTLSAVSDRARSNRISEDGDIDGEYMFNMEDVDSLENSFEYFDDGQHGKQSSRQYTNLSPLSSYQSQALALRIEYGACTKIGPKTKQEDRFVVIPNLKISSKTEKEVEGYNQDNNTYKCENAYFAVYDGHCGVQASEYVNEALHGMIFQHPKYDSDIETAIRESCMKIDQDFLKIARRDDIYAGTTAIGVLFHSKSSQHPDTKSQKLSLPSPVIPSFYDSAVLSGGYDHMNSNIASMGMNYKSYGAGAAQNFIQQSNMRLTVFNIGDSRAVLCRNGEALYMSDAHSPSRPDEQSRIEAAKGWITEEKELFVGRLKRMDLSDPDIADQVSSGIQWTTIYRVLGEVSVSRSIGDYPYKGFQPGEVVTDFFSWPENHDMIFNADLVIPDPECQHVDIDELCEFVILACDGLWDVVSNEKAVSRVKSAFEKGDSPKTAAEELCNLALKLGSGDNITVIIVQFFHKMADI